MEKRRWEGKSFTCRLCGCKFTSRERLIQHVVAFHTGVIPRREVAGSNPAGIESRGLEEFRGIPPAPQKPAEAGGRRENWG